MSYNLQIEYADVLSDLSLSRTRAACINRYARPHESLGAPVDQLLSMVQFQIESLLPSGKLYIDTVAESLVMSRRTLQRRLAEQHQTYSHLLSEIRFNIAAKKLENSDQPIAEIAFELGYGDASNFTRAFRRKTGVSPLYFRKTSVERFRAH